MAQSLFCAQAAQSGADPSAAQLQISGKAPVLQLAPGQSVLVLHPWVHTWAAGSQTPLWQSLFCAQVPQRAEPVATVPHWQAPNAQASPLQSVGVVQKLPPLRLQWLVLSQLPLWQSLFWVQAAQMGEPAGGVQSQVWLPMPPPLVQMAPLGQLAELAQRWVHVWLVRSQLPLTQSALELHAPQVDAGQPQCPLVQVAPLQSADVVHAVSQSWVGASQ